MAATDDGSTTAVAPADRGRGEVSYAFSAEDLISLDKLKKGTVARRLFAEPFAFDFFQAVRLLEKLVPERAFLGGIGPPEREIVRLRTRQALAFPPSAIHELALPTGAMPLPVMTVAFLGLTGAMGVLPRHYTELILRLEREVKGPERYALRDWLDLFNHRLLSLFYRAWVKYRFYIPFERADFARREPDVFTRAMLSFLGLGTGQLRGRLRVATEVVADELPQEKTLAQINDLALIRMGGFLAHQPRCAVSLQALLQGYFRLPVEVVQHQGQWLRLETANQTSIGPARHNNGMGMNVVVGDRVWDIQSKIRVRLGPLSYRQFLDLLPDPAPRSERKQIYLLAHLVRFYLGMELDAEFQLILRADEVPACELGAKTGFGARLGWNTWARRKPMSRPGDEPVFQAEERTKC